MYCEYILTRYTLYLHKMEKIMNSASEKAFFFYFLLSQTEHSILENFDSLIKFLYFLIALVLFKIQQMVYYIHCIINFHFYFIKTIKIYNKSIWKMKY